MRVSLEFESKKNREGRAAQEITPTSLFCKKKILQRGRVEAKYSQGTSPVINLGYKTAKVKIIHIYNP